MDVILVPGLWLDASSWDGVAAALRSSGAAPHPLTLRGLTSRTADRSGIMLADHVAEITAAIDRCAGPVVLVGHAEACGLVHAAVNRRPERVAHAIHVGGFPSADGTSVLTGCPLHDADNGVREFDAVQRLTDERRFDVPTTVVATEASADDVMAWVRADAHPATELRRIRDVTVVELRSGRWPQIEHASELAQLIVERVPLIRPAA